MVAWVRGKRSAHLIITQPQPVVKEMKADDMVMKGLAFGMPLGSGKALSEHLLHQLQVRLLIKGRVKAQDGSGSFQVIAAEFQLCHGVDCKSECKEVHTRKIFEHRLQQ